MATQTWPTELPTAPATMEDYRRLTREYRAVFAAWREQDEAQLRATFAQQVQFLANYRADLAYTETHRPSYASTIVTLRERQDKAVIAQLARQISMLRMMINLRHAGRPVE